MLKVGVVGCGHLGKIHIKLLIQSKNYSLSGIYDSNSKISELAALDFKCKAYQTFESMLEEIDVLDIVTPTPSHFEYAKIAIEKGIHVFIEKPVCSNIFESNELINISKSHDVKIQVGHVERFNPAYTAVEKNINKPMFIESHRLAKFNPRGTDVSVVLDLMIHDIDIILNSVKSNVKQISSSSVSVISDSPDIANARIEFENGCVANLTASRVSLKNMRKTRFFQSGKYISIDFLNKESEVVEIDDESSGIPVMTLELNNGKQKRIYFNKPTILENNAILDELDSFANSIKNNTKPKVDIADGHNALEIALRIIDNFK
ncbi:MAG: oxidoreductase [Flavobacteriales bacterium]|jgi:predicted dehydrogenase|nr:oxidoreductase [Flavobacteriales bacterium]|tara:strand:- start:7048 stop:8004 length:957 start_codon:yes stop_codon:yes gene_type:complete